MRQTESISPGATEVPSPSHDDHAGVLVLKHTTSSPREWYIRPNDNFNIGRSDVQYAFGIEAMTISAHHLQVHCIGYQDELGGSLVEPLVYVRVLSSKPVNLCHSDSNNPSDACVLRSGSGDVLLNHGDTLQLTPGISVTFESRQGSSQRKEGLDSVQQQEVLRFDKQYNVTNRLIGSGGYAKVFIAVKQADKRQFACKVVRAPLEKTAVSNADPKSAAEDSRRRKNREKLAREYEVLKNLSHPNIIPLEKVFCTTHSIFIFQELITGGDLSSYTDRPDPLSEAEGVVIIRQVLKAVQYLHRNQIVHRDIKPENILMTSWRHGARVVLTDFGQARALGNTKGARTAVFRMQSIIGTIGYTAPEVSKQLRRHRQMVQGYSKAIDVWSVGCVAGILLTAQPMPFETPTAANAQARGSARPWDLTFMDTSEFWRAVEATAKSFIRGCLDVDEDARLTADQALNHEWFTNKHYATDLEAAYQRSIQDWRPRATEGNLVEFIDTSDLTYDTKHPSATTSHHFPAHDRHTMPPIAFTRLPPPAKKRTPLPAIGMSSSPGFDEGASQAETVASAACVPDSPRWATVPDRYSDSYAALEHDPSLNTQLTAHDREPSPTGSDWLDSTMYPDPNQVEFSPPETACAGPGALDLQPARATVRSACFAQRDESCMDVTQYTAGLDAPYLLPQRGRTVQ
ncbi:hypothetical protein LTR53_003156 [Teratosphaeriaceae sp. CCFEE 6253]|nr:hypothetical protein LTR53_003156 [Teratosphaeriaceae sp. CCFEE 6253]